MSLVPLRAALCNLASSRVVWRLASLGPCSPCWKVRPSSLPSFQTPECRASRYNPLQIKINEICGTSTTKNHGECGTLGFTRPYPKPKLNPKPKGKNPNPKLTPKPLNTNSPNPATLSSQPWLLLSARMGTAQSLMPRPSSSQVNRKTCSPNRSDPLNPPIGHSGGKTSLSPINPKPSKALSSLKPLNQKPVC